MSMEVRINGKSYSGLKSGSVSMSIEDIANQFSATLSNFWSESITEISSGDSIEIYMDGSKVLTGYIDIASPIIDQGGNLVTISGRSKAGDLVDCTPNETQSEFKKQTFTAIASALAGNFGIGISENTSTGGAIETVNYEQGETCHALLKREAEKKGLLLYSDTSGNVVIDRAGTQNSGLNFIEGENIINANVNIDFSKRFSKYIVRGDQQSTMELSEEDATRSQAIATDSEVRTRTLILIVDGNADNSVCKERAAWEATVRRGKSITYTVSLLGWYFNINQLCTLKSNRLGVDRSDLLITRIDNSFSEQGKICNLTLMSPDAFAQAPLALEKSNINKFAEPK